jgi:hypothetical protein
MSYLPTLSIYNIIRPVWLYRPCVAEFKHKQTEKKAYHVHFRLC